MCSRQKVSEFANRCLHFKFWEKYPALLFGLSLLVGTSSFLFWAFPWNWIWPFLWSSYLISLRKWAPLLLVISGLFYSWCLYGQTPRGETGYFSIHSLQPHESPFAKGLIYKGGLYVDGQRVPCAVHQPFSENHPKASCDYLLRGILKQRGPYDYLFRAKEWIPIEKTWSLAEFRFQMKERFRAFLEQNLQRPRVASFLGSLLTGDVEDRSLRYEFGKLGLQHILGVSGFHFAILILFCSFFLRLFLPPSGKILVLLVLINAYFLFVGDQPAVQRGWLMALFYLFGKLIHRQSSGLNLLGAALLIEVFLDPLVSAHLGFQFSFLSCIGIFLFRPLFTPLTYYLFPKHSPDRLSRSAQHGYLLTAFLREALSIDLAVNAAIFPLILYHFHSFPLLSSLYNLFFPFLVSAALFSLLLSLLTHLILPPLAIPLFYLTDLFTAQLLDLTAYPPLFLDFSIRVHSFPAWAIPLYLFGLFCLSLTIFREPFSLTNTPILGKILGTSYGDRSSVG